MKGEFRDVFEVDLREKYGVCVVVEDDGRNLKRERERERGFQVLLFSKCK